MMAREENVIFLELWLRSHLNSGDDRSSTSPSSSSSARGILHAWTVLRDLKQKQVFGEDHFHALKTLVSLQLSVHVADPQAKLLISILESKDLLLPQESLPLILRLLYIWLRKSSRPSLTIVDSATEALSRLYKFVGRSVEFLTECALLAGAASFVKNSSRASVLSCLNILCHVLEENSFILGHDAVVPDVMAGVGYGLSSSVSEDYGRILDAFMVVWGKDKGPSQSIENGVVILHLVEWVLTRYMATPSPEKMVVFSEIALASSSSSKYLPFVRIMTAGGVLRALNRSFPGNSLLKTVSRTRELAEKQLATATNYDSEETHLLACSSLAMTRSSFVSASPLLMANALVKVIFPMERFYSICMKGRDERIELSSKVEEHLRSVVFHDAGKMCGVFCQQFQSADDQTAIMVEDIIWSFCKTLYLGHREVALILDGEENHLLLNLERIAESAFLMLVLFASGVAKHRVNSSISMQVHVSILSSFSCIEYFRRIRLPEYMDTIRISVMKVQENESACISFVESMPTYTNLTINNLWYRDEVQTARISFYMRVIPTCIEKLAPCVFVKVAPTMFLYMKHPNKKVARAAHSVFSAFVSSGKDVDDRERSSLKEQLAVYYIDRSLEGFPGVTPFKGMASGVAALARNLPGGSPSAFHCVRRLVEKAESLCCNTTDGDWWKNWRGEANPNCEIMKLLLRLLAIVDVQVLPVLMKSIAELVFKLPKDGQDVVLGELFAQIADSDDAIRKPVLVLWLQSLSCLCLQARKTDMRASPGDRHPWRNRFFARL